MKQITHLTKRMVLAAFLAVFSISAIAQTQTVTGKVTSGNEALPGVSVLVKGTSVAATTDMDGNYSIKANTGAVLQFMMMSYATKEVAVNSNVIDVTLASDNIELDVLVVTALGIKRSEKALGYAVTELKSDQLIGNTVNPVAALQGKVAGVEIAGSDGGMFGATKIQIRGASTLKGNNQPIYVVDGVILDNSLSQERSSDWDSNASDYGNELKNLNPDDFETVSVLKGAAATALYGSRGLRGAVVITTKGGSKTKGLGVSFSQSVGFDHVYGTSKRQMVYGPGNYSGNVAYGDKNADGTYKKWDNVGQFMHNGDGDPTLIGQTTRMYGPKYDGSDIINYDGTVTKYSPIKSNMKDAYELGVNTNTNVSIQGGNETTTFYSSLSYKNAKGIITNNDFERYSYLLKASHIVNDWFNINGSVSFAHSKPENALRNIGGSFSGTGGVPTIYDTKFFRNRYTGDAHTGLASTDYSDTYGNVPGRTLWFELDNHSEVRREFVVRPTLEANFKLTDWVSFRAEANMNLYNTKKEVKNLGKGYDNAGNNNDSGGYYELFHSSRDQKTFAGTFTFNKELNEDFNLGGFLRAEYYGTKASEQKSNTDGGLIMPGQYFLDNGKNTTRTEGKIFGTKRMISAVAAVNLSWRNQVFVDITGRNDWSSALVYPNKTGAHSYFYPSVSGSWLMNQTLKMPDWISLGKIRASWAQVGNDTDPYSIYGGYAMKKLLQADGSYIYYLDLPGKYYSPNLRSELKNSWELGADWRFLKNRLGFDFTYYRENTTHQIMDIAIPSESGTGKQLINAGNIQNSGIEIALHTVPVRTNDWEWMVDFTYTRNRSKIKELHPNVADYIALSGDVSYGNYRVGSVAKVGGEYGTLMTDSKPKQNDKGQNILTWRDDFRVGHETRSGVAEEIGSLMPHFLGSATSNLRWKNLNLRVSLDTRWGGYIASYSNKYGTSYGVTETSLRSRDTENGGITWTSDYADSKGMTFHDGIIPDGVIYGDVKAINGATVNANGRTFKELVETGVLEPMHGSTYTYWRNSWGAGTVNDDWYHEVKYIALREIALSYRMPTSIASKIKAKGMNLMFSARNLGYLYNSLPNNLHPEGVRGNSANEFRERSNSPYMATYTFTIGLDF